MKTIYVPLIPQYRIVHEILCMYDTLLWESNKSCTMCSDKSKEADRYILYH